MKDQTTSPASPSISGMLRVTLADLRSVKFSEPLQARFDKWYDEQVKQGLVLTSFSIPCTELADFEKAVEDLLNAEQAIAENRLKQPPQPTTKTPDFIENILGRTSLTF